MKARFLTMAVVALASAAWHRTLSLGTSSQPTPPRLWWVTKCMYSRRMTSRLRQSMPARTGSAWLTIMYSLRATLPTGLTTA